MSLGVRGSVAGPDGLSFNQLMWRSGVTTAASCLPTSPIWDPQHGHFGCSYQESGTCVRESDRHTTSMDSMDPEHFLKCKLALECCLTGPVDERFRGKCFISAMMCKGSMQKCFKRFESAPLARQGPAGGARQRRSQS